MHLFSLRKSDVPLRNDSYQPSARKHPPSPYSQLTQGRRKHFRIGQTMKDFSLATLANVFSTVTTCKDFFMACRCLVVLKLMVAYFQFLKPLLANSRLPLFPAILLDFGADTHTWQNTTSSGLWVWYCNQGHVENQDAWHDLF